MVTKESKYGKYGIMELLPIGYLREFARGKDPSIKAKNKDELIKELMSRNYVTDQDLDNFNSYYDDIIDNEKVKSASIVRLSKPLDVDAALIFLKENEYEYDAANQIVSKDGFNIERDSPLSFNYWYDRRKVVKNPDNSIKEEHNTEKVEIEYKENPEILFFYTHDARKVNKVMKDLLVGENLIITAQRNSLSLEESYKRFQDFLNKLDDKVQGDNNHSPYEHVISSIQLFDVNQKKPIEKIFYESKMDILNDKEIIEKRKEGYFMVGIGGDLYFNDKKYSFRINSSREYRRWGTALTVHTQARTKEGSEYIKNIFEVLVQLVLEILI